MAKTLIERPKTTFWDIETSPNIGLFWRPGHKVSISYDNIIQERVILSAAWKHAGDDTVYSSARLIRNSDGSLDDSQIVADITEGLKDTEILIHHNGDRFDLPWVNGRALFHGVPRIAPVRTIDTLSVVRKQFSLNSYRLDYLAKYVGLETGKIKTEYDLWKKVVLGGEGSLEALEYMVEYNKHDVVLLEKVYNKIEPYNDSRVIDNTVTEENMACPFCGSEKLQSRGRYLNLKTYRKRYQCMGCGKFLKSELIRK